MRRVYTTTDPVEAAMLEMVLRGAGIDVAVENQRASLSGVGSPAAPLILTVDDKDEKAARAAIQEALKNRKADDGNPETPEPDS